MTKKKLTEKQKLFCKEYMKDLNATQAAIRAGYSKDTAKEIGYENLTKPHLAEHIQKQMDKRSKRIEITADYVLEVIQETMEKSRNDDDKQNTYKGAELLGKHLKLFTDKTEINGEMNITGIGVSFVDSTDTDT